MQYADKVFCTILFIATGSMLVIGTMQVFWRFILHNPLTWTEEFLRYLYVWATLLGIGVGIHRKAFTTVTVFSDFVKKRSRLGARMLHVLVIIGQLVFFLVMTYYGWILSQKGMTQFSPTMRIPMGIVYFVQPAGGVLGAIYSVLQLFDI